MEFLVTIKRKARVVSRLSPKVVPAKVVPIDARRSLILCAFDVGAVRRHDDDAGASAYVRGHHNARAVR